MTGRIIVAGPITTSDLRPLLDPATGSLPPGRGGAAVTRLVRGLVETGVGVTVVSADGAVPVGGEVVAEGSGLRIRLVPYRSAQRARDAFAVEREAVRAAIGREPSAPVHAHWTYEYALGALATGRPTLVTVRDWGPTILRMQPRPYRLVRLGMQVATLRRAGAVTANSPYLGEKVERWLRRPIPVVPNPIDAEQFGPERSAPDLHEPVILAVNAGWGRRKNVSRLLLAFRSLRPQLPHARLELVGPGYEPGGPAARWAAARDASAGVDFVGPLSVPEVLAHMRRADVFVHPSLEESFGNVLVEAMAQALPVVGGRSSGAVPWVLADGAAGVLADVRSPMDLADAIAGVLTDRQRWLELSAAGRENAWDRFRTGTVVTAYLRLYDALDGPDPTELA